jgi:hypothetical protein
MLLYKYGRREVLPLSDDETTISARLSTIGRGGRIKKRRRADNQKSTFLRALSLNLHISKIAEPNYHASPRAATADPHNSSAVAGYDSEPEMISAASSSALGGRAQSAFVVV